MKQPRLPAGWDEKRIQKVIEHYENQTEDEAVAEAEAAYADPSSTVMIVPHELVPLVDALIAKHQAAKERSTKSKPQAKKRKRA